MSLHRYRFILSRPLQLVPVLFGISIITFVLVRLIPGDPARVLLGAKSTPEAIARIRAQFGLDEPIWLQYVYFLKNLGLGDMGKSILYKVPVLQLVIDRVGPTLALILGSVLIALALAIPLASIAATQRGRFADHAIRIFSTAGLGFPPFWLAIMLIILFSVKLDLFPVAGWGDTITDQLHHLVLP